MRYWPWRLDRAIAWHFNSRSPGWRHLRSAASTSQMGAGANGDACYRPAPALPGASAQQTHHAPQPVAGVPDPPLAALLPPLRHAQLAGNGLGGVAGCRQCIYGWSSAPVGSNKRRGRWVDRRSATASMVLEGHIDGAKSWFALVPVVGSKQQTRSSSPSWRISKAVGTDFTPVAKGVPGNGRTPMP